MKYHVIDFNERLTPEEEIFIEREISKDLPPVALYYCTHGPRKDSPSYVAIRENVIQELYEQIRRAGLSAYERLRPHARQNGNAETALFGRRPFQINVEQMYGPPS